MKYYYLLTGSDHAICFSNKKSMIKYATDNSLIAWVYTTNKRTLPKYIKSIVGNGICKDYTTKNDNFVIKNSLKERRK